MSVGATVTQESETQRRGRLKELTAEMLPEWEAKFAPGSFGCHELLDRTAMIADQVEQYVLGHPSAALNAEWYALADRALTALRDLYGKIGSAHLDA